MKTTHNPSIALRFNPTILRTKSIDNPPQTQIQATGHKSRCNSQANNLNQKAILLPLILPGHNSPHIAQDLQDNARHHGKGESCGATGKAKGDDVAEKRDREESKENDVSGERDAVEVVGA